MVFIDLFELRSGYYVMQKETGTNALCPCFEMSAMAADGNEVLNDCLRKTSSQSASGTEQPT